MKCSLGILAYNEEGQIASTLQGLLEQDLWKRPDVDVQLVLVVNGTTDRTVERATEALRSSSVEHRIHDLEHPGKANAWNRFVHDLSRPGDEVLILVDADIDLPEVTMLSAMVDTLQNHPEAAACVDEPVKCSPGSGARDRLSQSASALASAGPPKLCGQLYAARAEALRTIFLPEPLLVEDGFIKAMLTTDAFTKEERPDRLVRAEGVWHSYEAEASLRGWLKHEKRILLGTLCNLLLFEKAREWTEEGAPVGETLRGKMEKDPEWFRSLIQERLGPGGTQRRLGILLPVPWRQMKHLKGAARLKAVPVAMVRSLLTLLVMAGAAYDLRKGRLNW